MSKSIIVGERFFQVRMNEIIYLDQGVDMDKFYLDTNGSHMYRDWKNSLVEMFDNNGFARPTYEHGNYYTLFTVPRKRRKWERERFVRVVFDKDRIAAFCYEGSEKFIRKRYRAETYAKVLKFARLMRVNGYGVSK